ncbi:vacuolar protein sorting-associated protein 62 domain-containing protein [Trichoderma breve]|uniref:Vacuolar protein sorting-associated protein 62 domain-containing protein n=1 Tax=Trichoderma breve TaxID=2034170 RepID=A0A9W9EF93_9HYPO|nr:vacuolar protein sorting-associated protein 62 domain-containing protein [Trichoderma breve]KAJ4865595.1 vacuolar protein sorting-associated protein 62 domain-containing protein [Trichoderma breve]
MAGQYSCSFARRLCLSIALLAVQLLCVLSKPTTRDASSSSILAESSRIVPDYVTQYAPLVWLHSDDPFRPADLLQHIRHTTPATNQSSIPNLPKLDLDNLALLNDVDTKGGRIALTSNDDITGLPAWLYGSLPDESGRIANATPCVVILVEKSARDVDAFFFYFYSYDRGDTKHGMHFGDHVGDWEHNMVRFRDGKPTGIYYSQHVSGSAYNWNDKALSMKGGRPFVFSAYGSHANYASTGNHVHDAALVDFCDAGRLWDPVLSAYFYHLDPASFKLTRLFLSGANSSAASNFTSFFYFTGIWGDEQYPDNDIRQKTVPHFGLKRFVSGPQGPIVKNLVRKGLHPDQREKKPWMQWAVGIFMFWYPCCIRGWRLWVSLSVVVGFIILTAFGIRYGIKKYRRTKGYKKLETTDIPLNDMSYREESSGLHRDQDDFEARDER